MAVSDLNILPVYKGGLIKINTGDYSCLYSCAVVIQPLIETAVIKLIQDINIPV